MSQAYMKLVRNRERKNLVVLVNLGSQCRTETCVFYCRDLASAFPTVLYTNTRSEIFKNNTLWVEFGRHAKETRAFS